MVVSGEAPGEKAVDFIRSSRKIQKPGAVGDDVMIAVTDTVAALRSEIETGPVIASRHVVGGTDRA
jgi:hypothetical protein